MAVSADMFDAEAERYDAWFDTRDGRILFQNELAVIRLLWREEFRPALEVGVGTGRFAQALEVEFGIDPAAARCDWPNDAASRSSWLEAKRCRFPMRRLAEC